MGGIGRIIRTPLGAVLIIIITLVLAGLSVASAVSGELTAAAINLKEEQRQYVIPLSAGSLLVSLF